MKNEIEDRSLTPNRETSRKPILDMIDEGDRLVIKLEMPGINPTYLDINVFKKSILVRGKLYADDILEDIDFVIAERNYGVFHREIELPVKVIPNLTRHQYSKGILKIMLVKA